MPGRNAIVYVLPSLDRVQLSASHGSTSSVTLLMRIKVACISTATRSVVSSRAVSRVKLRGSVRMAATTPPLAGPLLDVGAARHPIAPTTIRANTEKRRNGRVCPVKSCPGGQKLGRSELFGKDGLPAILHAKQDRKSVV